MPKESENIPFLNDEPLAPSEPQGFAADQMVGCQECSRANPPTRTNCLYCAAPLPVNEKVADYRKPNLAAVESGAQGYNVVLQPSTRAPTEKNLAEAAALVKLDIGDFSRLLTAKTPLPLVRTASLEDSALIRQRLQSLAISTAIVSDKDLRMDDPVPTRARTFEANESYLTLRHRPEAEKVAIPWSQLILLVTGRVLTKRVEVKERKVRRGANQIEEASELYSDDTVMDLYSESPDQSFRIFSNRFDYSSLDGKSVVAAENFSLLIELIRVKAPRIEVDDSYNSLRQLLDLVWPAKHQVDSRGWRRERLGKLSFAAVTESSTEIQFTRYSRLLYLMKTKMQLKEDHA